MKYFLIVLCLLILIFINIYCNFNINSKFFSMNNDNFIIGKKQVNNP